jgi:hypothetical protein
MTHTFTVLCNWTDVAEAERGKIKRVIKTLSGVKQCYAITTHKVKWNNRKA